MLNVAQQGHAVAVAASAGGIFALIQVVRRLVPWLRAPIFVAAHLPSSRRHRSELREVLAINTRLPVCWAADGQHAAAACIYLAPQDQSMTVGNDETIALRPRTTRPCPPADPLFASVAACYRDRAIGVVLSGCGSDGALGARHIVDAGGTIVVQDRDSASFFDMPRAAIERSGAAMPMPLGLIAAALVTLTAPAASDWVRVRPASHYMATLES